MTVYYDINKLLAADTEYTMILSPRLSGRSYQEKRRMSKNYVVEKVFECNGFICVIVMSRMGHRCGYVGVPKSHRYYGKAYYDIGEYIDCHGGLTYSGGGSYPIEVSDDIWWFGWDYAHYNDGIDWISLKNNFDADTVKHLIEYSIYRHGYPYSIDDVKDDCKAVATQLKQVDNSSIPAESINFIMNRFMRIE